MSKLHGLIRKKEGDLLQKLKDELAKNPQVDEESDGLTPLMVACKEGLLDVVDLLVQAKAEIGKADEDGRRAIHWAAWGGHQDIVQFLESSDITSS